MKQPKTQETNPTRGDEAPGVPRDSPESTKLVPFTAALLDCVTPSEVVSTVVERVVTLLGARAGLVALVSKDGESLEVVRASGYSVVTMQGWERFPLAGRLPLSDAVRENTILYFTGSADWRARYPEMVGKVKEGFFQASVSLPLAARGRVFGGLHFSFPDEREFSPSSREFLGDLALQCALALDRALLLERVERARDEAENANGRLTFLARASALLAESLDYQTRLEEIVRLCVPELADWAGVDVVGEDGEIVRLAVAHRIPERESIMREIQERYSPESTSERQGTLTVIQSGVRLFYPNIPPEWIDKGTVDAEHARLLKLMGVSAALSVPITARGRTLGALSLGMGPAPEGSGRSFTDETVALVEELARRAAVSVDNARLYADALKATKAAKREAIERREAEARFRVVADAAPVLIWTSGADGKFDWLNESWIRFTGRTMKQDLGAGWTEGVHPNDVAHCLKIYLDSFHACRPFAMEYRLRRHDGEYRWLLDSGVPIFESVESDESGAEGIFKGYIGSCIDITEIKQAEAERERLFSELERANERQRDWLRQSEERFRLLVEGVRDYAIFMLDPHGFITTWNAGAERFKGYKAEEIIGRHFSQFYTEADIARRHPWTELEIAAREGRYEEEGWRVRKDGTQFWASVVITALRDDKGKLIGYAKVTRDVTERRLREQERAKAEVMDQQRRFLKDILSSVTQGRLVLCDGTDDLPEPLASEPVGQLILLTPKDLKPVRTCVAEVIDQCKLPPERAQDFITAVSECAMNAVVHAGGGTATVYEDAVLGNVQVWIEDEGSGIDLSRLPRATLEAGFSTGGGGIGHGFSLMIACCRRVYLLTGANGTTLVLEQDRTSPEPPWLHSVNV